jgi:hypothetical protein
MPRGGRFLIPSFALAKLALHLATARGYGYFRDEFYYLACADHLSAGYVDQPPLSILALWLVRGLLGDSRLAIRLLPALLGALTVALVGITARRLGGARWATALAMAATLAAPEYLALNHFYSMNSFDIFFWALTAYLLVRLIQDPRAGLFILLGLTLGLGLLNKISVLWLGAGLGIGLIASPQRRWLRTPWPWLAACLALAIFAPHIAWQMRHGWPTLEFIHNATTQKMAHVAPLDFVAGQIETMLATSLPLWLGGLLFLFFHQEGRTYRMLGWIYSIVFLILVLPGSSRAGYLAPAYTWLFAAGGVALERLLDRPRRAWMQPVLMGVLLGSGAAAAPLAMPILPVDTYIRYARVLGESPSTEERKELGELGQFYADMHGWDAFVVAIAEAHGRLAPEEKARARVFAPDYGVAGAVDLLGRRIGLPPAISGHNNYWLWGPRGWDGRVLIVVGSTEERLRARFESVERVGSIDCGRCMPYENHRPVWIVRDLRIPVAELWGRI